MPIPVNQQWRRKVDKWLSVASQALIAPRCLLCGEVGADGLDLCAACRCALPASPSACPGCARPLPVAAAACRDCRRHPSPFGQVHAACRYAFPVDRLLPRFKFHADLAAGAVLGTLLADSLAGVARPQALIPVPLHGGRLRARGFDQALELARGLARVTGVPLRADGLRRIRATAAQSELGARSRQRNVARAFACLPQSPLPAHVALIDDVLTTGATLRACACALQAAGVARVDAWVVARAAAPGERD